MFTLSKSVIVIFFLIVAFVLTFFDSVIPPHQFFGYAISPIFTWILIYLITVIVFGYANLDIKTEHGAVKLMSQQEVKELKLGEDENEIENEIQVKVE